MSHTNSTTNYNLPQFLGTDKPAWLGDINPAMSAIDTQMKLNADTAGTASATATTNASAIGTLTSLTTTDKTDLVSAINEVDTELGTVSGVASGASTSAGQANTKIDNFVTYMTLANFAQPTATITGGTITNQNVNCATNANGTVAKLYGVIDVNCTSSNGCTITIPTAMRPESELTIAGSGILTWNDSNTSNPTYGLSYTIATNGNVTIRIGASWYNRTGIEFILNANLLFLKDFGDTPVNP